MKKLFGLCILVIFFLVATGCTQSTPSIPATTTVQTTVVPETTTSMATTVPTENATPVTTVDLNATTVMTNVTTPAPAASAQTTVAQTPPPAQTQTVTVKVIHIQNGTFVPAATTVLPGTGITWVNDDIISHAVKATGDHTGMFNSGDIAPGSQWSYTFGAVEGNYGFTEPQFLFNGTIVVQKPRTLSDYQPAPVPTTT
jgi:plastocyanin